MRRIALLALLAASWPAAAEAHPAWGILVDGRGTVYFADVDHGNVVRRVDERGKLSRVAAGKHSHDLFRDARGDRYVADVAASVDLGYRNNPLAGEIEDEAVILKRRPDGNVSVLAGSEAGRKDGKGTEAMFRAPGAMAWGTEGALYVAEGDAIRKVTVDGTVTTLADRLLDAGPPDAPFEGANRLFGLTLDARNDAYVADFGGWRVLRVAPDRAASTVLRSERPWSPVGVAESGGCLDVLEVGATPGVPLGPRVRKVAGDGKITTLATVERAK
ncbi:MAG: gluconolaconase [Planctomycetota bacterium]|nr:gluconolaconase [Planctomycetota bacterium]